VSAGPRPRRLRGPEAEVDQWATSPLGCEFVPIRPGLKKGTPTCRRSRCWSRASRFRPSPTTTYASERAFAMLSDRRCLHLAIIDIAFASGFRDVSHFNRVFARRFGETPSAVRAAAIAPEQKRRHSRRCSMNNFSVSSSSYWTHRRERPSPPAALGCICVQGTGRLPERASLSTLTFFKFPDGTDCTTQPPLHISAGVVVFVQLVSKTR
jgi:AraC-like DNA-binding protein